MTLVSNERRDFFRTHGYLLLRQVIPPQTLINAEAVVNHWVTRKINEWIKQGLIEETYDRLSIEQRFIVAWEAAGRPEYRRNVFHYNIHELMYELIRQPVFLDIAGGLLQTGEISASGVNNVRLKHSALPWSVVPWHADMFYWEEYHSNDPMDFIVQWFPLHKVDATSGCLQIISTTEISGHDFEMEKGEAIIPDQALQDCNILTMEMEPGDVLCMCDSILHRSVPNTTNNLIWTIDNRYEPTTKATKPTREYGLVVRSSTPTNITSRADWLARRAPP